MVIIEKIVPPRNSGRNARRRSGGISGGARLSSIFTVMANFYSKENPGLSQIFVDLS